MSDSNLHLAPLREYLANKVAHIGALQSAEKFSDGQSNPTYLLHTTSGKYVLRKQPPGQLLRSAHAVDREYRVMKALNGWRVPVPTMIHFCDDTAVLDCLFFIMSYEPGRIFWNPALPELTNDERTQVYDQLNLTLSSLHDVNTEAVGLSNYGKSGNYFSRQIDRWTRQYYATETESIEAMHRLIQWLPNNVPKEDGQVSLIHGDFRIDNVIFHRNQFTAKAVIDWELSTLGHPFADLAYQCMQWRLDVSAIIPGLGDLDRAGLGIPTEEEYVLQYCERRQISKIDHWDFYLVFSFFRMAAILQGVLKRSLDGNASNVQAREYGALAPIMANMALQLID